MVRTSSSTNRRFFGGYRRCQRQSTTGVLNDVAPLVNKSTTFHRNHTYVFIVCSIRMTGHFIPPLCEEPRNHRLASPLRLERPARCSFLSASSLLLQFPSPPVISRLLVDRPLLVDPRQLLPVLGASDAARASSPSSSTQRSALSRPLLCSCSRVSEHTPRVTYRQYLLEQNNSGRRRAAPT